MMARRVPRGHVLRWSAGGALVVILLVAAALRWWPRDSAFLLERNADQNVLLITIDTLRADAMSSYGGAARTPNLDRLAASGARFTFAHAHAVVTLPSHTTILSGRLPYEHGMRDNSGFRVKDGTATLATRLKAAGFATGAFVGGFPLTKRFGLTPGFDTYDDQMPELTGAIAISMPERRADVVVGRAAGLDRRAAAATVLLVGAPVRPALSLRSTGTAPVDLFRAAVSRGSCLDGPGARTAAGEACNPFASNAGHRHG